MVGASDIRRLPRRFAVTCGVALLASLFLVEPAVAQLRLGSSPVPVVDALGSTVENVTQQLPLAEVDAQTAPVVRAVAEPLADLTAPLAKSTAPITEATTPLTKPVLETVTPVVQATAPVLELTKPVVGPLTAPVLETAAPVLDAVDPVLTTAGVPRQPIARTTLRSEAPGATAPAGPRVVGSESASGPETAPAAAVAAPTTSHAGRHTTETTALAAPRNDGVTKAPSKPASTLALEPIPAIVSTPPIVRKRDAAATRVVRAAESHTPGPNGLGGPVGLLGDLSASSVPGAALLFVAALAAMLFLAAPGPGRRLRLGLAPWPRPLPPLSLERPG
jgi:hypothetical protein